jgi:glutathione synthase/RimK-type ligase-like ATP-grasp enzyme
VPAPVALVSCAGARDNDTDLDLIVRALGDRGRVCEVVDWDDASVDWSRFSTAIVRSPWDYHRRYDEFLAWVDRVSALTVLHNPAGIIRWNTDKTYLAELGEAGIPVIPTTYVRGAEDLVLANDLIKGDVVVKPTVSAGSNNTERHRSAPAAAAAHVMSLVDAGMTAMVQPYQRFIDDNGETGMLYFNGEFSHAFRKGAILATGENSKNGLYVVEDIGPRTASEAERELGDAVIGHVTARFGTAPLYARVDVVRGSIGAPVLMELELAEPSLFLHTDPQAPARFASAVVARR